MRKRREIQLFSISFLDLLSGALGAVIILYIAVPKAGQKNADQADKAKIKALESQVLELKSAQDQVKDLADVNRRLRDDLEKSKITKPLETSKSVTPDQPFDVGFKFKGNKIVFVIDTSYSMYQEDRIGQVKAGLKMLITSMQPNFKIDVVQYPNGERTPFKPLWAGLKDLTSHNKHDVYDFVYSMKPLGATPTREALLYVLSNYDDISDIVVLSDGAPSLHNSSKKDDIYDILKVVREHNPHKVQISTIGVGKDFINDKTSDYYKFLQLLADENKGFFVGF